ncbi:hypothetical protein RFI_04573 [Reticulomyxa filosa]|uniref:Uncharacterized protein n=1 Tax=Reticulomyxa filosa TaxID=46433 RepID=X6P387_RETFI|nr:hypothetical protein RFI_04573 [Reticulomyxa filosa]|eukprot:ETO32544.1 hypothetical protein RFI_04573 [Reticulomyxa filosa]
MKSSLMLVVLHVLNTLVVLNAHKTNTSSCSWASGQTHSSQHGSMNILLISCDVLTNQSANYMWKLKMWNCDQYLQICNNVVSASSIQISNIESMPSENKIIRILQINFVASPRAIRTKNSWSSTSAYPLQIYHQQSATLHLNGQCSGHNNNKKNGHEKKKDDYVYQEIGGESIGYVFCVYILLKKNLFKKKNKNNILLKICKLESMISMQSCNSDYRVWIGDVVGDQLPWAQHRNIQKSSHQHHLRLKSYCPTSPTIIQCCNVKSFFFFYYLFFV